MVKAVVSKVGTPRFFMVALKKSAAHCSFTHCGVSHMGSVQRVILLSGSIKQLRKKYSKKKDIKMIH